MARKWSARMLAVGGLAVALGCRSHPNLPPITTPLLPETVLPAPTTPPTTTPPTSPPLSAAPAKPTILPPGASIQPPPEFAKLPEPKPELTPILPAAPVSPELPPVVPPADVQPILTSNTKPAESKQLPVIKPMFVDAPRPAPGPDGFAPGPRVLADPPPEPVRPPDTKPAPPTKIMPIRPGQRYGNSPDYKWVAGVLDKHQKGGFWTIRYADIGTDDMWGGKVRLLDDPRLAEFKNGDVIYVEGELLAPKSAADGPAYPPYRVTDVRVVEKTR